jgi:hypothetical protein
MQTAVFETYCEHPTLRLRKTKDGFHHYRVCDECGAAVYSQLEVMFTLLKNKKSVVEIIRAEMEANHGDGVGD